MILDESVDVKIIRNNIKFYKDKGYVFNFGDTIAVKICDLPLKSNVKINAKCYYCGAEKSICYFEYNRNISKYNKFSCSHKCSVEKVLDTKKEKYGIVKKSGNKVFSKGEYFKSEVGKIEIKTKMVEKYGVDNIFKSTDFIKKNTDKNSNRTISKYLKLINKDEFIFKEYNSKISMFKFKHLKCDLYFSIKTNNFYDRNVSGVCICTNCFPISKNKSIKEKEIVIWLNSLDIEIVSNNRKILKGKELDIFIFSYNLAIEFNGLYHHSDNFKNNTYHLEKSLICLEQGIDLIHIWEDEWIYKKDIVKSIISNRIGLISKKIYARCCDVRIVNCFETLESFLNNNHIDGYVKSDINIGLYYNNELVCLMCLKSIENNFEIVRNCSKLNYTVIGGVSKLFSYFKKNYFFDEVISYTDFRLFSGKMFGYLGFVNQYLTKPDYFLIKNKKRIFDDISNSHKVYDCGKKMWLYKKKA